MKTSSVLLRPGAVIPAVLIAAAVLIGAAGLVQLPEVDRAAAPPLSAAGEAQLGAAAERLAEPGLFVDPEVPYSRLDGDAYTALKLRLGRSSVPIRVAVLPAAMTREGQISAARLASLLQARVDQPGVYAVLVDERGEGRLAAGSWGGSGDRDAAELDEAVAAGVDAAAECCAADYPAAIETFTATVEQRGPSYAALAIWGGLAALVVVLAIGWALWLRNRARLARAGQLSAGSGQPGQPDLDAAYAGVLHEELAEIGYRVAALPADATPGLGGRLPGRVARARYLLAKATALEPRLSRASRAERDVVAVVRLLADLRLELAGIEELQHGEPVSAPTPPCFLDPRHGPSRTLRPYTPTGLELRTVTVCASCAGELAVGQRPAVRQLPMLVPGGSLAWDDYWRTASGRTYVEGYWGAEEFPDRDFQTSRPDPPAPVASDPVDDLKLRLRTDRE